MDIGSEKMLLINCSNREKNCFKILNDIKSDNDILLSLSNKDMKFCLGCDGCKNNLEKHCVLDDYITNTVYQELLNTDKIVIASPMYMSNINGISKNLIDRMNPFYHHPELFEGKKVYLILTGQTSKEENINEINNVIDYFKGLSELLFHSFDFLDYFEGYNDLDSETNYDEKIKLIKEKLK